MSSQPNFTLQWDDMFDLNSSNTSEMDSNEFCKQFLIDPSDFDDDFLEDNNNNEICTLANSKHSGKNNEISTFPVCKPTTHCSTVRAMNLIPQTSATEASCSFVPDNMSNSKLHEHNNMNQVCRGFIDVTKEDIDKFNNENRNKNTVRKQAGNMRKINKFLKLQNVTKYIHEIPMCQLDELLAMFILSIRKEDGEEYETTSIRSFISSIERELQHHNYPFTVGKGERQGFPRFHETCAVSSHSSVLMYTCKFKTLFKKCFIYQIINFLNFFNFCNKMKNYRYSSTSF